MSRNISKHRETIDTSRRIVQIIPAQPGWEAVYALNEEDGGIHRAPLVCWALVESGAAGGLRHVTGMILKHGSDELFYAEWGRFLGYNYPGASIDWEEEAKVYHEPYLSK